MKTTKFMTMALLLAAVSASMSSCSVSDNEKSPEQVEDPIKDAVEYYIVGQVTHNGSALSGVTVTTTGLDAVTTDDNGQFSLMVSEQKDYTLDFTKDGYLQASTNVKLAGLSNRSSIFVSIQMTQIAAEASIPTTQDVLIEANSESNATEVSQATSETAVATITSVGAYVPQEAIEEGTKLSMTEYVPEATSTQVAQTSSSPILAIHVATSNGSVTATEENPIVLSVKNPAPAASGIAFQNLTVYKSTKSRADESLGEAVYDAATNSYNFDLTSGELNGNYEFRVAYTRSQNIINSVLKEGKVDNSGNFAALMDVTIAYEAQAGWLYTTAPSGTLAELIKNAITAQEGTEGTYTINYEEKTNVSGNNILYWKAEGKSNTITYTFPLTNGNITATLKKYLGVSFTYTNESANQHSGGTGSTTGSL